MSQFLHLLDRPVAFQRAFVRLGAGVTGALLLSQLVYWQNRMDGEWFYKTQAELEEETGLSRYEQETARKKLTACGVLEEAKRGIPAKIYFWVNEEVLISLLIDNIEEISRNQGCGNPATKEAENQQAVMGDSPNTVCGKPTTIHTVDYTETTQETTRENSLKWREQINSDARAALSYYNELTSSRCRDAAPFAVLLTPTTSRPAYTLNELKTVIRWVVSEWKRRDETYAKPANICRVKRFDGYLADATAWAASEATVPAEEVIAGYNEILGDVLPHATLDDDRRKMIRRLLGYLANQTLGAFLGYFEKFRDTAPEFYFGGAERDGWRASFDYLMKPEILRKTREGSL